MAGGCCWTREKWTPQCAWHIASQSGCGCGAPLLKALRGQVGASEKQDTKRGAVVPWVWSPLVKAYPEYVNVPSFQGYVCPTWK